MLAMNSPHFFTTPADINCIILQGYVFLLKLTFEPIKYIGFGTYLYIFSFSF